MATGARSTYATGAIVLALLLLSFATTTAQSKRKPSSRYISYASAPRPDCLRAGRPVFCRGVSAISGKPSPRCACQDPAPPRLDAEMAAVLHRDP